MSLWFDATQALKAVLMLSAEGSLDELSHDVIFELATLGEFNIMRSAFPKHEGIDRVQAWYMENVQPAVTKCLQTSTMEPAERVQKCYTLYIVGAMMKVSGRLPAATCTRTWRSLRRPLWVP